MAKPILKIMTDAGYLFPSDNKEETTSGKVNFNLDTDTNISENINLSKAFEIWKYEAKPKYFITRDKLRNFVFPKIYNIFNYLRYSDLAYLIMLIKESYGLVVSLNFKKFLDTECTLYIKEYIEEQSLRYLNLIKEPLEEVILEHKPIDIVFKKFSIYHYHSKIVNSILLKIKELYDTINKDKNIIFELNDISGFVKLIFIDKIIPNIKNKFVSSGSKFYYKDENRWVSIRLEDLIPEIKNLILFYLNKNECLYINKKLIQKFILNLEKPNYLKNFLSKHNFKKLTHINYFDVIFPVKSPRHYQIYDIFIIKHITITNNTEDIINKIFMFETFSQIYGFSNSDLLKIKIFFDYEITKRLSHLIIIDNDNYVGCIMNY